MTTVLEFAEKWRTLIELLSFIAAIFAAVILAFEVYRTKRVLDKDAKWRRRSQTFQLYTSERLEITEKHRIIRDHFGIKLGDIISEKQARELSNSPELKSAARFVLGKLERLAAGIELEVYDYDVVFKTTRNNILGIYGVYESYIKYTRSRQPNVYNSLEILVERLALESELRGLHLAHGYVSYLNRTDDAEL